MADAARSAGEIARARFRQDVKAWKKADASPVTEVDLAVNAALEETLRRARPDYGWLSEESADDGARLNKDYVFIVDPIDGTRAFMEGAPEFCISIGLARGARAVAGVVYNPVTGEMFTGAETIPAAANGAPASASARGDLADAHLIGKRALYESDRWPAPWPPLRLSFRQSLALRLSLVATGAADGAVLPGYKHEWDIAAGAAIVAAAGGRVSDPWGAELRFNQEDPRAPGVVAAGPALHDALIARTKAMPHPSTWRAGGPAPRKQESA